MMKTWNQIWTHRSGREKILIAISGALIVCVILWQLVYKPVVNYPVAQKIAYDRAVLDLKIMQNGQSVLMSGQGLTAKPVTTLMAGQLQPTITSIAKEKGLKISRRQPKGDTEITIWLEKANSKAFYAWVDGLTGQYNIELQRALLNRNDGGTVRAQVTFVLGDR